MTVRYYDRLNRFGIDTDKEFGQRLIFPQIYLNDFIERFQLNPFKFRRYAETHMSPAELFLYSVYSHNKKLEDELCNTLYPTGILLNIDFILGENDQNLIEILVSPMDNLGNSVSTIWMRDKPNGKTKQEVYDTLVIHFKRILANLIGVPDDLGQQNKGWQHSDLIEERFTSKPVESNNWKAKD